MITVGLNKYFGTPAPSVSLLYVSFASVNNTESLMA
jgi:hypothetical protein